MSGWNQLLSFGALAAALIALLLVVVRPIEVGAPDLEAMLVSSSAAERLEAVRWLDRDQMVAHLPQLAEMAVSDPDPAVRNEVIREIGYSQDPRALPVLDAAIRGRGPRDYSTEAFESLGYYGGTEGCQARLFTWWKTSRSWEAQRVLTASGWRCLDVLEIATDADRIAACDLVAEVDFPAAARLRARAGCAEAR